MMGESSTAIYEKLIEKIGGLTPLTAAEAKKLKLQGQQFADGLNAITPDLAVTVRKHINNLVAAAGLAGAGCYGAGEYYLGAMARPVCE
ncbi:hypothetical protein O0544_17725 [Edwardsiella anguillarum]|nr:hypothetical protein [Edwardsiella anguillarum]